MPFIDFNTGKKVQLWDGVAGSLYHSGQATFGHVTLQKGIDLPEHHHFHEQWTHVIEGEMLFRINGEEKLLTRGMTAYIPSNLPHSAKAITECRVIDCFLPVREDLVEREKNS